MIYAHFDCFVLIKFKSVNGYEYKVLAGNSGSYLYGSSWKANSGIESYAENSDGTVSFFGYSGSEYRVHIGSEGVRMSIAGVLKQITDNINVSVIDYVDFKREFTNKKAGD